MTRSEQQTLPTMVSQRIRSLFRTAALPFILCVRGAQGLKRTIRRMRLQLWRVQGAERASGLPLTILCAASNQTRHYVLESVFGDSFEEHCLGHVWIWKLANAIRDKGQDCAMLIADVHSSRRGMLKI